jgi:hypothetical protein
MENLKIITDQRSISKIKMNEKKPKNFIHEIFYPFNEDFSDINLISSFILKENDCNNRKYHSHSKERERVS